MKERPTEVKDLQLLLSLWLCFRQLPHCLLIGRLQLKTVVRNVHQRYDAGQNSQNGSFIF